jgi:hypothetical protein
MLLIVKTRYRIVRYRNDGGMYFLHDKHTGKRVSLETKDKHRATELLVAHNEAAREPAFNLQKARVYMAASDPGVATRTWGNALSEAPFGELSIEREVVVAARSMALSW